MSGGEGGRGAAGGGRGGAGRGPGGPGGEGGRGLPLDEAGKKDIRDALNTYLKPYLRG
jgi:hypothetical protein